MFAHDSDWFQTPHWKRVRSAFYSTGQRADTSCEGHAAVGGRCYSSSSDLGAPVITPYTPQSGLLLACQSQQGAPPRRLKPFIGGLVQVLASIWHTAHVHKHVKYRAACCCIVQYVCQCLLSSYGILYVLCRLTAVTSHWHCLCNFLCAFVACSHSFIYKETKQQSYSHICGPMLQQQ